MRSIPLIDDGTRGSEATTHGLRVSVRPSYLPEQSKPGQWLFAYNVEIFNESMESVQLLSRHWVITDADGRVEEVSGPGVVGEQPVIGPGDTYDYESYCPLPTPFGTMRGSYKMRSEAGHLFDVRIATFELAPPMAIH